MKNIEPNVKLTTHINSIDTHTHEHGSFKNALSIVGDHERDREQESARERESEI